MPMPQERIYTSEDCRSLPEEAPLPDEIVALLAGRKDRNENGTIPHDAIDWD